MMTAVTNSQNSSTVSDPYNSSHDSVELSKIAGAGGVGSSIYDEVSDETGEEIGNLLTDFGYVQVKDSELK
jgi:hypothetical protein